MSKRPETRAQALDILERYQDAPRDNVIYPHVVETTHRGERTWDIFSRLLKTASCSWAAPSTTT